VRGINEIGFTSPTRIGRLRGEVCVHNIIAFRV